MYFLFKISSYALPIIINPLPNHDVSMSMDWDVFITTEDPGDEGSSGVDYSIWSGFTEGDIAYFQFEDIDAFIMRYPALKTINVPA